jgi:hypothetical protein
VILLNTIFFNKCYRRQNVCGMRTLRNYSREFSRSALFLGSTQRIMVIPCRRFGRNTYRSHLQESWTLSWPLKMEPVECPETSTRNYHHALRNDPEERSSYLLLGGSLKWGKRVLVPYKWSLHFIPGYSKTQRRELLTTLKISNV